MWMENDGPSMWQREEGGREREREKERERAFPSTGLEMQRAG